MSQSDLLTDLAVLADRVDGTEWVGGAGDVAVAPELLHTTNRSSNYRTQPDTAAYTVHPIPVAHSHRWTWSETDRKDAVMMCKEVKLHYYITWICTQVYLYKS